MTGAVHGFHRQPGGRTDLDPVRSERPQYHMRHCTNHRGACYRRSLPHHTAGRCRGHDLRRSEAAVTPLSVAGFSAMRALSTRNDDPETASRPWDRERDGFVIGEGAGILVLEDLEFARNRGAKILSEIIGYGMSADAYHITQPAEEGEGGWRVMMVAINDDKLTPQDIDYVNAH